MSRSVSFPWNWRPSRRGWYQAIQKDILTWQPDRSLCLDVIELQSALLTAADTEEDWLFHPCSSVLFSNDTDNIGADFQLVQWTAAHVASLKGFVTVSTPLWAWRPSGGQQIEPGRYRLSDLAATVEQQEPCGWIALDVWADSIGFAPDHDWGFPAAWSWASHRPLSEQEEQHLKNDIMNYLRAMTLLAQTVPDCQDWVAGVTKVVLPLCRQDQQRHKSSSGPALPGMVLFDLNGSTYQLLEAMVHESAHQYLFVAEADQPLIDPLHDGRYSSPLRSDPRPLRGILLAFHALAYMSALYRDLAQQGHRDCAVELDAILPMAYDSGQTLKQNAQHLTSAGRTFVESTEEVCNYARR